MCGVRPSCFSMPTATTGIYTLSLHDALPILRVPQQHRRAEEGERPGGEGTKDARRPAQAAPVDEREHQAIAEAEHPDDAEDRKSTRLNSSHLGISYAVFCLKKKRARHGTSRA